MRNPIDKIKDAAKKALAKKNGEIDVLKEKLKKANAIDRSVVFKMPEEMVIGNFPTIQKVEILNPQKTIEVQKVHIVNHEDRPKVQDVKIVNHQESTEKSSGWVPDLVLLATKKISDVFVTLWSKGLRIKLDDTEQTKPLKVIVVDLDGNPTHPEPSRVSVRSSPGFPMIMHGNVTLIAQQAVSGRITISTPGTPVQLPNMSAKTVIFTALSANGGVVCIGGKTVNATAGSESGSIIYPTGSATFNVNFANALFVDGSNAGDVVIYNIMS